MNKEQLREYLRNLTSDEFERISVVYKTYSGLGEDERKVFFGKLGGADTGLIKEIARWERKFPRFFNGTWVGRHAKEAYFAKNFFNN